MQKIKTVERTQKKLIKSTVITTKSSLKT